jgi:CheY-like chemotaxis protein
MPKKLLLVDDEELFLRSMKEGLDSLADIFQTDICYSVNEAIKNLVEKSYDLVITDIRMPGKSGIELLIYLKQMGFKGKAMVMSAYSTDDTSKKVKTLGVVDVISKPFKFEWFKNMLLNWFREERGDAVTFESIDLVTVMQIINLEKKTSALQIDLGEKQGMIYFIEGEVVHAQYNGIEGERAVLRLITLNSGVISVKKIKDQVKRNIDIPFVELMMSIMKTIDEVRSRYELALKQSANGDQYKNKEVHTAISEILDSLTDVKGYMGCGVFTPSGELLEGTSEMEGLRFEETGTLIRSTLSGSEKMSRKIGFGDMDMIQLYSNEGVFLAKCYNDDKIHFHTILVVKTDGNVAMGKLKLKKAVDALKAVF